MSDDTQPWIDYQLELTTSSELTCWLDEPEHFIAEYSGVVSAADEDSDERTEIGRLRASVVRVMTAMNAGYALSEAFDADAELFETYYPVLVDPDGWIREDLIEFPGDVVIVRSLKLSPKWRGRQLGLRVLADTVHLLGRGCCLAAIEPAPLNAKDLTRAEEKHAQRQLAAYWERLAFRRVRRTRVWATALETGEFDAARQTLALR